MSIRKPIVAALLMLIAISSPGCMRYAQWRNEMASSAAEKHYSKAISSAAGSKSLLGTWMYERSVPPTKKIQSKPIQYALSLFADQRFSMTMENPNSWNGRHIREYHGTWRKTAPGIVQLSFEELDDHGSMNPPSDVDLNKASNCFVTDDQKLKE